MHYPASSTRHREPSLTAAGPSIPGSTTVLLILDSTYIRYHAGLLLAPSSNSTLAMGYFDYWTTLSPGWLNFWIQAFSVIAIFFEGYDQGVMGGVK